MAMHVPAEFSKTNGKFSRPIRIAIVSKYRIKLHESYKLRNFPNLTILRLVASVIRIRRARQPSLKSTLEVIIFQGELKTSPQTRTDELTVRWKGYLLFPREGMAKIHHHSEENPTQLATFSQLITSLPTLKHCPPALLSLRVT